MVDMRFRLCAGLVAVTISCVQAQDLKALAEGEFQKENYPAAIAHLERYLASNPDDAEGWAELATSLHFHCYDSTPRIGYELSVSDKILHHLQRALSLNPNLRTCYELMGSEYGARATNALQGGDWNGFLDQLSKAQAAGAFPEWLLEYAENMLGSCKPDAILFTGGDAEVFPVWYSQYIRGIRTDVTLAPVTLLDRPWFLAFLKSGRSHRVPPMPLPWTLEQCFSVHPFKWVKMDIELEVPLKTRGQYHSTDTCFVWSLSPDLEREGRTFLSVSRAAIKDVVIANKWERPIHFSFGCHPWMLMNLNDHLRICAMTQELVPFVVKRTQNDVALEATQRFLNDSTHFRRLASVLTHDLPGTSALLTGYRVLYLRTCGTLLKHGEIAAGLQTLKQMEASIPEELLPMSEEWRNEIRKYRGQVQQLQH